MTSDSFVFAATGDAILSPSVSELNTTAQFDALCNVLRGADAAVTQVEPVLVTEETTHAVAHDADNWRSIVPRCEFTADGTLTEVTLYPCTLQPQASRPRRGTPVLATDETALGILRTVAERSVPFGTTISIGGNTASIDIA